MKEDLHHEFAAWEADVQAAVRAYSQRCGEPASTRMPFDEMLEREADDTGEEAGEYEFAQRRAGVRAFLRFISGAGPDPREVLKLLYVAARAMRFPMFTDLSMTECALLLGETKAAHSYRGKLVSGLIRQAGMRGTRLPGQKSECAAEKYAAAQRGNQNRKKKRARRSAAQKTKAKQ